MKGNIFKSGYVSGIDNKIYIFTYNGELLQLVPRDADSIKSYDSWQHKKQFFEEMEAVTTKGEKIYFLRCELIVSGSGYIAKPGGYICFMKGNRDFNAVVFKGKAINYFYRPNNIVGEETRFDNENGGGNIKLKSFDETLQKNKAIIDKKEAQILLGITQPNEPVWMEEEYTFGKPESVLELRFKDVLQVKDFKSIYMWIYNLLVFLNFRRNIEIGDISLGCWNQQNGFMKVANVYIVNKKEHESVNVDDTIGYYFVKDNLSELFSILNEKNLNLLFIPKSRRESMQIDVQKYLLCCTSFESIFNYKFPNAKQEDQAKAKEVKQEFLDFIANKRKEYEGKDGKRRKEFKKYADIIELLDFSLEEKIKYCIDKYEEIISIYIRDKLRTSSISVENMKNMIECFVKKRNLLTHSNLIDFEEKEVIVYLIVRALIYIMIFDAADIKKELIVQALDKVL